MAFDDAEDLDKNGDAMDVWRFGSNKVESGDAGPDREEPAEVPVAEEEISLEKRYSIKSLQQFSQYLNKESSSRYRAIVLNAWINETESSRFEVGIVDINNGDDRNGVVLRLKTSPFHVNFISLDEVFFNYAHSQIYDAKTQTRILELQKKKLAQKTKNWGEGQSHLSADEALAAKAASDADFEDEAEEWLDLTDEEEYRKNIERNEAELTTQEFIRLILAEFLRSGASDMHIEAGQPTGRIRFRYDAEMFTRWDSIPFVKIKQLCMGLAETSGKDATQMKFKDIDSTIKVRAIRVDEIADVELRFVSQPTLYAPSIVLRSQLKPIRDIREVGFLDEQIRDLRAAYSQKRGMLIITGATGSGKTNTLESIYAALEETDSKKIIEIGEPIEIRSNRRTQMSLRPNTPFTWWDAFYSCLRADPDIIGIGELRSGEHMSVAINAALTGHLVLSTFHAASVEDTLSRLFQIGLPRENISTGLNMVLAQTLVKKLCDNCRVVDEAASERYKTEVYMASGCPQCFNKGTRGRTAMGEMLYCNDDVKGWLQDRELSARDVVKLAVKNGYLIPMRVVAREKVRAGITSEQEVAAVLGLVESTMQAGLGGFEPLAVAASPTGAEAEALREAAERHEQVTEGDGRI